MYLVLKESNRKCRRSSDLKKLTYADGPRTDAGRTDNGPTPDKSVSDNFRLTKVSGAKNRPIY